MLHHPNIPYYFSINTLFCICFCKVSFYVYQYATGFSAAIALSKRIRELGAEGVADYMKFLTGGGSKYPIDLLKLAGVDMTSPQPVKDAIKVFEDLVAQLEELDV